MQNEGKSTLGAEIYMRRSLELAQRAKGHTAPNPMVGAVLVHDGRIIGEGWHHNYGGYHAEVDCIKSVAKEDKSLISESIMFVNLEPCAHHGLTPPCAVRLVEERVKKVVISNEDPFDKVNGRGIGILKEGGVEIETGVLAREGAWENRRFFCFHRNKRPYIILKWAQTKDGFMAPANRSRMQITGIASRQLAHKWRAEEAAIMVGTTTALNDNPELTARLWKGKQPVRIVPDRYLQLPRHHHIFNIEAPTWILNELEEGDYGGLNYIKISFGEMLLPDLMQRLYHAKIVSLIVEGGAALLHSYISLGLWDEARIFTGNIFLNEGITAPVLKDKEYAFTDVIGHDTLQVFVNKHSHYPYIKGMEL